MFVCFLDAAAKDITGVKLYIESGKDLNVKDQMGYTALILGKFMNIFCWKITQNLDKTVINLKLPSKIVKKF